MKCKKIQDAPVEDACSHTMHEDGMGNSLNNKWRRNWKRLRRWMDR
jgi:hypothetical protein